MCPGIIIYHGILISRPTHLTVVTELDELAYVVFFLLKCHIFCVYDQT